MDYKKIFRGKRLRQNILRFLSFVPDRTMVRLQYRIKFGRWPDLRNPKRFTEKLLLYKIDYHNPLMPVCSDKYAVREFLENKGLGNLLPELYGVFDRADDIPFESLPDKFVIKTNDGGGGDNIVICRDKRSLDIPSVVRRVNSWLGKKNANPGREWAYSLIPKSVVIVEELLENPDDPEGGIEDYKFFCFDGKPFCLQYDRGRQGDHRRNFYDMDWTDMHIKSIKPGLDSTVPVPEGFDEMKRVAAALSKGFPHVRVDLYSVGGKVYFGEMTFYTAAGYTWFDPDSFDTVLGDQFDVSSFLPKKAGNK